MILFNRKLVKTISALMVLGMVFSCKNSIDEIDALTDPYNLPIQTTEEAEYIYSEKGKVKNKLIANVFERYSTTDDERIVVSEGFEFFTYDSLEQVSSKLSAQNGVFYQKLNKFVATNKVELSNSNGEKLNTEELIWLQGKDRVYTNKLVKVTTEDGVLWGDSLSSNSTFDKYELFHPRGEVEIKE